MGRVASSLIKRPVKNWNVENRAQKFLEKQEKPQMAPRHPSSEEPINQFSKGRMEQFSFITTASSSLVLNLSIIS